MTLRWQQSHGSNYTKTYKIYHLIKLFVAINNSVHATIATDRLTPRHTWISERGRPVSWRHSSGWRTKTKWTKAAYHNAGTCIDLGLVPIQTLWSIGPNKGLSSLVAKWSVTPDSQQQLQTIESGCHAVDVSGAHGWRRFRWRQLRLEDTDEWRWKWCSELGAPLGQSIDLVNQYWLVCSSFTHKKHNR